MGGAEGRVGGTECGVGGRRTPTAQRRSQLQWEGGLENMNASNFIVWC